MDDLSISSSDSPMKNCCQCTNLNKIIPSSKRFATKSVKMKNTGINHQIKMVTVYNRKRVNPRDLDTITKSIPEASLNCCNDPILRAAQINQPSGEKNFVTKYNRIHCKDNCLPYQQVKTEFDNYHDYNNCQEHGPLNKEIRAFLHESISSPIPAIYSAAEENDNSHNIICSVRNGQFDKIWKKNDDGLSAHTNSTISNVSSFRSQSHQSNSESKQDNEDFVSELSFLTDNAHHHHEITDSGCYHSGKNSLMKNGTVIIPSKIAITNFLPTAKTTTNSTLNFTRLPSQFTKVILNRKSGQHVSPTVEKYLLNCRNTKRNEIADNETTKTRRRSRRRGKDMNSNIFNLTSAGAHSISSLLFNFILFSTFLFTTFNYCNVVVQGEIFSTNSVNNYHNHHQQSNKILFNNVMKTSPSATNKADNDLPPQILLSQYHDHKSDNHQQPHQRINDSTLGRRDDNTFSLFRSEEKVRETFDSEKRTKNTKQADEESLQELLSKPLESLDKNALIKALWDALTPDEIHRIFGHHKSKTSESHLKAVPNFDLTKPKITSSFARPSNNNGRGRKRRSTQQSSSEPTYESRQNDEHSLQKTIQLEGLGRQFTINIYPNQKLLDPYFVHLHRHKNRSEILPQKVVQQQLQCFYQGRATHMGRNENSSESGAVAMSLCGGLKGFILPFASASLSPPSSNYNDSNGQQYHYVIHPLPDRLLKTVPVKESTDREENGDARPLINDYENEGHDRHHIIFRRPGTLFSNIVGHISHKFDENKKHADSNSINEASSSQIRDNLVETSDTAADSFDKLPTCMHHDIKTVNKPSFMKYAHKYNGRSDYDQQQDHRDHVDVVSNEHSSSNDANNNELDVVKAETMSSPTKTETPSKQKNEKGSRMKPIIPSNLDDSRINDLESLIMIDENKTRLKKSLHTTNQQQNFNANAAAFDSNSGHNIRRQKRSPGSLASFDSETIDPFTYKPLNIAPDSYWVQFRDRSNNGGSPFRSSAISDDFGGYNGNRRLSSQFSYDDITGPARFSTSSGPSSSFQPSFWHHNPPPSLQRNIHGGSSSSSSILPHNLASRPARGSRYDEIPTTGSDFDEDDTGVAGSDHMTWSKGILVFESSGSNEDRHYPGKDVPFYTKTSGNKRKAKGISTSSSIVSSTSSTSSTSSSSGGNSPTRSFDWFGGGIADTVSSGTISGGRPWSSYDKNRTATKSYSLSDSSSSSTRKGRRDDGVFGDKWKTSLDSEIIWADRSNEINKQAKFDDLSNVKDRPPSHLTIETAVFVDKDLYKHMQQNFPEDTQGEVTRIVLAMINAVQLLYQDPSLGHRVDFVLKRLEVLESDPPTLIRPYDIDRFLTNFCKWQKTENPASDADPLHWDHALILTGLDLYVVHQSGKISNQVVGLAPVAGMCTRSSSCTVNEGRHFESVFVVAHEIGHNLGMRHDGPQAENNCDPTSHIMSPTLGSGKITWSPCSKKYLDLFLDTSQAKCLFDKAKPERWLDHAGDGRLPGERFDADRQCVLKYGRGSFHATQQPLEDVCRDLHCRREFFTWTSHPALDGTRCSANDDMWCRAGKCVPKLGGLSSSSPQSSFELSGLGNRGSGNHDGFSGSSNHLSGSETAAYATQKALDGGWGKWSPFTDCSSACLYSDDGKLSTGSNGVRLAARRCDSPRPENGGRQCSGQDRKYKTCSPHKICTKTPSRTTVSQYAAEVCSRAAQVDTELTGRGYMSSSNDLERACSVWCETNDNGGPRSRGWSFPDGTVCKLISNSKTAQTFCIAGKCQEFSCNPYSHFRLSEDDCSFSSSNDVIPSAKKNSNTNNGNSNGGDSWFSGGSSGGVKINHRSGKIGWSDWEVQSECKLACLAPAKGLQLVKRHCASDDTLCTGLSLSVRLCKPDKLAVQSNGCSRLQTPFEYATKVCSKYSDKVSGLSGIGMQLSPTKDDSDRPCRIGCQDASIAYRFYMVNGEEGWFPAGTDCTRGDQEKKAYCMAGKCIDFGEDDTPLYQISSNLMGSLFQQHRNKRQAVYNIMEPLKTEPGMDESSLKELVQKFSQETGNYPSIVQRSQNNQRKPVDFSKPVIIPTSSTNSGANNVINNRFAKTNPFSSYVHLTDGRFGQRRSLDIGAVDSKSQWNSNKISTFSHRTGQPTEDLSPKTGEGTLLVEGTYYEWRKIVSDCSVACGAGIQEVIVQCVSGDTVVNDSLCQGRPRPGYSGYINCQKKNCTRSSSSSLDENGDEKGSHLWKWIQSILPPKNMSYI